MTRVTITFEKTFQLRDDQDPMTAARIWETDAGFKIVAVRPADMSADNRGQADNDRLSWKGHCVAKCWTAGANLWPATPTTYWRLQMAERWIEWIEPFGPESQPVYMRVPESTAVAVSKTIAASKGHTYANDQQALDDFVTVHWAKVIEPKPEMRVIEEFFALPEGTEKEHMRQALRAALFEIFVEVSDGKCAKQTT